MRHLKLTRVEEDQSVSTDQVDTTATGFAAQQEDELFAIGVIELIDELLTLVDCLRAV